MAPDSDRGDRQQDRNQHRPGLVIFRLLGDGQVEVWRDLDRIEIPRVPGSKDVFCLGTGYHPSRDLSTQQSANLRSCEGIPKMEDNGGHGYWSSPPRVSSLRNAGLAWRPQNATASSPT